ncbi:MAG: MtrB/PioB family outer membrane beta-barrel protein, partial [Elusimicrobia bacterium]|nr:MtrB/PioB family outer membrane beta-barrel protein [Elusimicrobiota bacterium]
IEGAVDLGGRKLVITGSSDKFNEYRDLRDGLFVDELKLGVGGEAYYAEVEALNGGRKDESYKVEGGRYGKFKAAASFDRMPHRFATGRFVLNGAGSDVLGIPSAIQNALQATEETRGVRGGSPNNDPTGKDLGQQNIIRDLISNTNPTSFGLERRKAALAFEYALTDKAKTWVKASEERRKGFRQLGMGSYERYAQNGTAVSGDGGHRSDTFLVEGQQVAEPIDYRINSVNLGAGFYDKRWSGDLEYTFTEFIDELKSLTWHNPFRATDASANTVADADATDAASGSAYNRFRGATGRYALPPTSRSHDLAASGSVELPLDGRASAALGFGTVAQDADLLPYTTNTDITAAIGAPAGVTTTAALPTQRFNGKARTLTQSLLVTLKPADKLTTRAKYRSYTYDNQSPTIRFPGYAAYSESHWRTRRNDSAAQGTGVTNELVSYNRQTAELGADYDLLDSLTAGMEAFWDKWAYKHNRVDNTSEVGAGASLKYRLGQGLHAHGKCRYSRRAVQGYKLGATAVNPEAVGLENFNWSDRKRHSLQAGLSLQPAEGLNIGLDGRYVDDTLGAQRFGLKGQETMGVDLEVAAAPSEAFEVSLSLGKEVRRSEVANAAKDNGFNNTATSVDDTWAGNAFNPLNYWNTELVDKTDTVSLEAAYRPADAWEFTTGYSFSYGRVSQITTNPNAAAGVAAGYASGVKLDNAAPGSLPTVTSRLHELRLGGAYKLTKDVSFGLDYAFSKYMLNDFANVGEYVAGSNINENSTRFVLGGADKYDYTAHIVGARLAMKF